jgi:hypothetical protein
MHNPFGRLVLAIATALICLFLLLPVFVVVGVLYLFVISVRSLGRLLEPRFAPWTELMTFDPALGWKPRPNLDAHYLAWRDDVFHVVTDGDGWPGARSVEESPMVVIGDSFAFGYGVDWGRSYAELNGKLPIKSLGAPGYSMVHGVLLIEQLGQRLAGKLVVWFVCLENDLEDNLGPALLRYRSPFAKRTVNGWEIADRHVTSKPWHCSEWGRRRLLPNLCVPGPIPERAYAAADYLVGRAAAACQKAGAHLVLLTVPDPTQLTPAGRATLAARSGQPELFDENVPDRRLAESCQRFGVTFIAGKDHLSHREYKRIEALHWNERGHRLMSDVLGDLYESFESGLLAAKAQSVPASASKDEMARVYEPAVGSR